MSAKSPVEVFRDDMDTNVYVLRAGSHQATASEERWVKMQAWKEAWSELPPELREKFGELLLLAEVENSGQTRPGETAKAGYNLFRELMPLFVEWPDEGRGA